MSVSVKKQTGAVTVLTAMLILIIVTTATFMVGAAYKDHVRGYSDSYREKLAFEAANVGLNVAMEYLFSNTNSDGYDDAKLDAAGICKVKTDVDVDKEGCRQTVSSKVTGALGYYWVGFCDPNKALPTSTSPYCESEKTYNEDDGRVLVFVIGSSDDLSARRYISVLVSSLSGVDGEIFAPITGGNVVELSGSTSIKNRYGRSSVWSAGGVTLNNNKQTEVLAPQFSIQEAATGKDVDGNVINTYTVVGSDDTKKGADIIENDSTLAGATEDDFFRRFLQITKDNLKSLVKVHNSWIGDTDNPRDPKDGGIFYFNDMSEAESMPAQIGSAGGDKNAIVVIDVEYDSAGDVAVSDLKLNGNTQIYGILFVVDNLKGTGTVNIDGGLVVKGEVRNTGDLAVDYDAVYMEPTPGDQGVVSMIGGSWKDWLN